MSSKKETFVQIGVTALRAPDGTFLPSVPLYVKAAPEDVAPDGRYTGGDETLRGVAEIFADKYRQYIDGQKAASHH